MLTRASFLLAVAAAFDSRNALGKMLLSKIVRFRVQKPHVMILPARTGAVQAPRLKPIKKDSVGLKVVPGDEGIVAKEAVTKLLNVA